MDATSIWDGESVCARGKATVCVRKRVRDRFIECMWSEREMVIDETME